MLYIASDHGGFTLKTKLINYFQKNNIEYQDLGPYELDPEDDYTSYVQLMIERMREDQDYGTESEGILLCRNGVGVNIMANKFKGIRAALSFNQKHAESTRNDDHANILTLPSDFINEQEAIDIATQWLKTPYSNAERHIRRTQVLDSHGE